LPCSYVTVGTGIISAVVHVVEDSIHLIYAIYAPTYLVFFLCTPFV